MYRHVPSVQVSVTGSVHDVHALPHCPVSPAPRDAKSDANFPGVTRDSSGAGSHISHSERQRVLLRHRHRDAEFCPRLMGPRGVPGGVPATGASARESHGGEGRIRAARFPARKPSSRPAGCSRHPGCRTAGSQLQSWDGHGAAAHLNPTDRCRRPLATPQFTAERNSNNGVAQQDQEC